MPSFTTAVVTEVLAERPGLQRVATDQGRAYALTDLVGPVAPGDAVVLNTTAVELGLGSGGWHVVHWNLARDRWSAPGGGHLMKLRYTSLQVDTGAADEHHAALMAAPATRHLGGLPVVVGTVHSQLAAVAVAFAAGAPGRRLVYVMTDGAALPLVLSDLVADLRARGLLAATITAGHAFGGDHEAVGVPSALVTARHLADADAVVVVMGPGVVGAGTPLGTTALEAAAVLDVAGTLGGRPALALRASSGDARPRHRGVSHHALTVLGLAARAGVVVPVPAGPHAEGLRADLLAAGVDTRHRVLDQRTPDVADLLAAHGMHVTTMGRGPRDDALFFAAAAAAGAWAGQAAAGA